MEECKMHKDSMNFSTPGHMTHNQASTQGSLTKSLKCSHCKLVFRSKSYLFEHLNMVHGLDVNAESFLRNPGTNKASADSSSGSNFECQNCDFKAPGQDVLNEHAQQCQKKSENQSKIGAVDTAENAEAKILSTNQQEDAADAAENASVLPVTSTSKTKCTVTSSKDMKTYKRPSQTIIKYIAASSGSNLKLAEGAALSDSAKGTLILQQSPSGSSPNSSGVFKVTAKRTIDISGNDSSLCLLEEGLLCSDRRQPKSQRQIKQTQSQPVGNRTKKKGTKSPPAKKKKSDKDELKLQENESTERLLTSREFAFEYSDDEDEEKEKKGHLVNGDIPSPKSYFCKHCDFSGASVKQVSTHYHNVHPYIRFNSLYIEEPGNRSVTFRCLECPVEFLGVRDLKKHYVENHAEAPDVFTMQAHELCLRFKCFLCPFTTDALQALKKHYKENHPIHQVDNSLMSCKYSVTRCPEGPPQFQGASSPGISQRISHESAHPACMEVRNTPPLQPPTPKDGDVTLYYCNNCNFSHKSVVVMHVHYQKCHPDEEITIDKLKQSVCVTSHTSSHVMLDKSPDPIMEKSTPLKSVSDPTEKTRKEPEPSPPSEISPHTSLIDTKLTSETDSEATTDAESSLDRSERMKFPTKRKLEMDTLSCSSQNKLFYCKFCSYTSINIKSLVAHHNVKHPTETLMDIEDIVLYSTEVEKGESEAEALYRAAASDSKSSEQIEVCGENELQYEDTEAADASGTGFNAYACAENLFYCQKCNFANVSVKGILNHQHHAHKSILPNSKPVLEHTATIRDEIRKSKPQETDLPFSTRLPLPLMSQADENVFFCHFCNYRRGSVKQLLQHYSRKHQGFLVASEHIYQYTSMVLKRSQTSRPKTTADSQDAGHAFLWEKEKNFKKSKKLGKVKVLPSARASQPQRVLLCQQCPYSTQYVYLLKRHICKIHKTNCSLEDVLRECFKQGALQAGFHCDMCVFSHQTAIVLHKHYKSKHPGRKLSLDYVSTRLHIGPETSTPIKKRPHVKPADGGSDASDGGSPFQRSGQSETKAYSCKACSFKGVSMSSIAQHYRAVHPWSVKEDGSVLDVVDSKRWSENAQLDDHDEAPPSFETYQVPLEFDSSANSSSAGMECPHCSATFSSQRGLSTHCGMKHRDCMPEYPEEQQEERAQTQSRTHVFKCPYCCYVNNSHHGVVTHCQMKHPDLESRAENLHLDEAYLDNWNNCTKSKSGVWRLRGYMCVACPQICPTMEKLDKHCETDHCKTAPNGPNPPLKASVLPLKKSYKSHSSQGAVLKASFMGNKLYGELRCQHCLYSCRTKLALIRHVRLRHKGASISKAQNWYTCALCSSSFRNKKQLGNHYTMKHGKESFLKYFSSLFERVHRNPAQTDPGHHLSRQPEATTEASDSATTAEEAKKLVFKCPECPYVNASYHGTLTHCQMRHPDLEVRADALQTDVILVSNMVRCKMGKGSNETGYMCRECPQIHMSLKKLKIHCKNHHEKTEQITSETETERQPDYSPQYSVLEAFALKSNTLEGDAADSDPSHDLGTPETGQEYQYECNICTYKGSCRKYLYCHYKNTHKFDALTTLSALEKYNKYRKRKRSIKWPEEKSEESEHVKCNVCPDLTFDTPQLLIAHYSTSHISNILDFTVLSQASKRTTGLYICALCNKQMNGTKKLHYHLDIHREKELAKAAMMKASPVVMTTPEAESTELYQQDELPMLENVEDLNQWNVTPVETFTLPTSPLSSPPKAADLEQSTVESGENKRTCKQCGRTFMSLKGLRSHERSHAALAAIKNLDKLSSVASKHNIDKYMSYKPGTQRPFLCSFCPFRTTVMGLWRCHFMKNHINVFEDPAETDNTDRSAQTADKQTLHSSEELNSSSELDNKSEITENSLYLEPPDVQRQLDHYNLMAQAGARSKAGVKETKLPHNSLLHCELCNFNTGHMSSIRRHYLNRHGKKLLRCKKCEFFTSLRKTLEMHMERGHSTYQSEATHQKDLRCPFCLYQTKNKNNMIDHIVLHREERVVPIEVRRSKLSRYLRGIVFRCHKCTFTCGSAENLRAHMMRHEDIKPYKCRLCYFDCPQLSDLEAHLTDKHQVLRNHELVGQVSLDEMEARAGSSMPEENLFPGLERQNRDSEDVKTEEFLTERTQAKNPEGSNIKEKSVPQTGVTYQWRDHTGNKESRENTKLNAAFQEERGQDTAAEQGRENTLGQDVGEENSADIRFEDCNRPEKEGSTNDDQSQRKLGDGGDSSSAFTNQKNEALEGTSTMCIKVAENMQAHKLHIKTLKHRTLNIVARIEEDFIRHTTLLNDNGSFCKTHKVGDQEGTVKMERNIEPEVADNVLNKILLLDKQGRHTLSPTPKNPVNAAAIAVLPKKRHWQANNIKAKECFSIEKHLLSLKPNCGQPKISHKELLAVSFANCKEERVQLPQSGEEVRDPYGEMPVLENEYLKEEMQPLGLWKDENDRLRQKQDKNVEMVAKGDEEKRPMEKAGDSHVPEGALTATDGATEVLQPAAAENKLFTCEYCGRSLMNSSELERHIKRHGL